MSLVSCGQISDPQLMVHGHSKRMLIYREELLVDRDNCTNNQQ